MPRIQTLPQNRPVGSSVIVQLRLGADVDGGGDGSGEVRSRLNAEIHDPVGEPAGRNREWRKDDKILAAGDPELLDLIADRLEVLDESRRPVHQETGVC